jgi:hypothetical protein
MKTHSELILSVSLVAVLAASLAAVLAAGFAAGLFVQEESFESSTDKIHQAILDGDGETLARYMNDDELAAYGLSGDQYGKFLKHEVVPAIAPWKALGEPVREFFEPGQLYSQTYRLTSPGRQPVFLRVEVARTDRGFHAIRLVPNLITCLAAIKYPAPKGLRNAGACFYSIRELSARDRVRLAQQGMSGLYDYRSKTVLEWSAVAALRNRHQSKWIEHEEWRRQKQP